MDDRDLLGLAAKALGNDFEWNFEPRMRESGVGRYWNPLSDDGDALRLAVLLEIYPTQVYSYVSVYMHRPPEIISWHHREPVENNRMKSTRRAIVRAAAEIGKNMP